LLTALISIKCLSLPPEAIYVSLASQDASDCTMDGRIFCRQQPALIDRWSDDEELMGRKMRRKR